MTPSSLHDALPIYSDVNGEVGISQSGNNNDSYVTQSGQLSAAFVDQIGDGNTASISQSVGNNPNPTGGTDPVVATAEITQSGNGNYSTVNQFGGSATQSARLMVAESRSEEHTSELQSLMRISYAVF